jgi:AmiR/NasT family two-component response regulator
VTGNGSPFEHRVEVHQAQGMVSVQVGCTLDEALSRMKIFAAATNSTLEQVADDVINRRKRFEQ